MGLTSWTREPLPFSEPFFASASASDGAAGLTERHKSQASAASSLFLSRWALSLPSLLDRVSGGVKHPDCREGPH